MTDYVKLCLLFVHRRSCCSHFRTVGLSHRVVSINTYFCT